jgi:hypothetical protein
MTYRCTQTGCNALVPDGTIHSCLNMQRTLLPAGQSPATTEVQAMSIAWKAAEALGDAATGYQRLIPTVASLT